MTKGKKRTSLRGAINNYCKWCIFDSTQGSEGGWRNQVAECTSKDCPLFSVRPLPHYEDKSKLELVRVGEFDFEEERARKREERLSEKES